MSESGRQFTIDLEGCARCGGPGHLRITFWPFCNHPPSDAGAYTHWAICPTSGEPILMETR